MWASHTCCIHFLCVWHPVQSELVHTTRHHQNSIPWMNHHIPHPKSCHCQTDTLFSLVRNEKLPLRKRLSVPFVAKNPQRTASQIPRIFPVWLRELGGLDSDCKPPWVVWPLRTISVQIHTQNWRHQIGVRAGLNFDQDNNCVLQFQGANKISGNSLLFACFSVVVLFATEMCDCQGTG